MTAEQLYGELAALKDEKYLNFTSRLTRTAYPMLGVRIPVLRGLAREFERRGLAREIADMRPVLCYEQAMLSGILCARMASGTDEKLRALESFCGIIDDWAVCDTACASLGREDERFFGAMTEFAADKREWKARFGIVAVKSLFCDEAHTDRIAEMISSVAARGYYVDMAQAWLICECEIKVPGSGIKMLGSAGYEAARLAARKMRESLRVPPDVKAKASAIIAARKKRG